MSHASLQFGPLVSAEWLLERVGGASVVLLDARITRAFPRGGGKQYVADPQRYEVDGHIPGARFVDLKTKLSDRSSGLNFTVPSAAALQAAFRTLGVSNDSAVVAYDDDTGIWAARIWWLLRGIGHGRVAVLNGGLRAWVAAGGELEHGPGAPATAGDLVADPQPGYFVGHEDVRALSASPQAETLLCALDHDVFTGQRPSGAARDGHIPGSASFPYAALVDERGLIDPSRVDPALAAAGIDADAALVPYCGGGITACGVALALAAAGHTNAAIYDGSLQQWAADDETELAVGER
jgi:thiosulfate/3-mercaptopyruvate sulfurtransferase